MNILNKVKKFFLNFGKVPDSKLNTVDDIYVASMCRIGSIISILMELFELFLMTRLIILKSNRLFVSFLVTGYFLCYAILLFLSILAEFLILTWIKEFEKNKLKLLIVIYSFIGFILIWSFMISYLDLIGNQPFPAFVFLTIMMGVFTGVIGKPRIVIPLMICLFTASNIVFPYLVSDGTSYFDFDYFFNSITFFLLAGVISIFNFHTKMREWSLRLEAKANAERLAILAEMDSLTQLKNRMNIESDVSREANECLNNGFKLLCIQIDLDELKYFNDHYGHNVGDRIIVEVAKVIRSITPNSYRLGGDEFFLVLPCMTYDSAYDVVVQLQEGFDRIKFQETDFTNVTASIGCYFGDPKIEFSEMMKLTDDAVYYVKAKGRNGYYIINS